MYLMQEPVSESYELQAGDAGVGGGVVQNCNAGQSKRGAELSVEGAEQEGAEPGGGGGGAVCMRRGRSCVTHKVKMTRKAVKERVWKKKADGLFGNRTVVKSEWICSWQDFPKTVSQITQPGEQGVFHTAVLFDEMSGKLEHEPNSMDYKNSGARPKRLREWD